MVDPDANDFIEFDDDGNAVYECWNCGGGGVMAGCFEDTCCGADCDPEVPEYCCSPSRCDVCNGKGHYSVTALRPLASVQQGGEKGEDDDEAREILSN